MIVSTSRKRGFTIIELLVVLAAIGLLLAIVSPRFIEQVDRAREAVLRQNLAAMREAIDRFHADRARYPKDIQELVQLRYLRHVPADPVTDRTDSWIQVPPAGAVEGALFDVRSGATGIATDGTAYAKW